MTMSTNLVRWLIIVTVCFQSSVVISDRGDYLGCYTFKSDDVLNTHTGQSVDVCLSACEQLYYKYAVIGNDSTCFCGNEPGLFRLPLNDCNTKCPKNETQVCGGINAASVYDTDVTSPGPPASVEVLNFTDTTAKIQWTPPLAYNFITGYVLRVHAVHSYDNNLPRPLEWKVSNSTYLFELRNLHPGTKYNLSVSAISFESEGPNVTNKVETDIGTPEPTPPDIEVKGRKGDRMIIHIPEASNINGPVTLYRIVVSIEQYQQGLIIENLSNFTYAHEQHIPYYITAELDPDEIRNDFIVGDRSTYNGFYNAPLPLTNDIDVSLGIVSEKNNARKIRYADSTKKIILNINEPEQISPLVVGLGAAIAIAVVLLLIGIGFLIILRKKIQLLRRDRSSQSMPLNVSEPCLEIENINYLNDEKVDYYGNLKCKLWNIPRNLIDINISCVIGVGSYGKCNKCRVQQHGVMTNAVVQVISDKELQRSERRVMLQELDLLIKSSAHDNVLTLIGISETNTTLLVVLENTKESLKEALLNSRDMNQPSNKFSLLDERKVLQLCAEVACGMEYLHSKKIMHKKLCCRNIWLTESGTTKISGFGLSHIRPIHETPDYTRWTASEMLQQTRFNFKSDVWSYGCLLWEVMTLGATPYPNVHNKDIVQRVLKGMRPAQPSHVDNELFQLCLQCWQIDLDERPSFTSIYNEIAPHAYALEGTTNVLCFDIYNGFNYDPYVPHYELVKI